MWLFCDPVPPCGYQKNKTIPGEEARYHFLIRGRGLDMSAAPHMTMENKGDDFLGSSEGSSWWSKLGPIKSVSLEVYYEK